MAHLRRFSSLADLRRTWRGSAQTLASSWHGRGAFKPRSSCLHPMLNHPEHTLIRKYATACCKKAGKLLTKFDRVSKSQAWS
jgi:hypothetical protein